MNLFKRFFNTHKNYTVSSMIGSSLTSGKGYDKINANPYAYNVWAYACADVIKKTLSSIDRGLYNDKGYNWKNPIATLLENPNPYMDESAFYEYIALSLLLPNARTKGGQCFIIAESGKDVNVSFKSGEVPKELWVYADNYLEPMLYNNFLEYWKLTINGQSVLYKPDEVIRISLCDPTNPLAGQSPLYAGTQSVRNYAKMDDMNEYFFDNNANIGGLLTTDARLSDEERTAIRDSWQQAYSGQKQAGRVAVLGSGMKYGATASNHRDMQFVEQQKWKRDEIITAFGVPKFMIGIYEDLNFATADIAKQVFWENTLIPLDKKITTSIWNQWLKYYDSGRWGFSSDYSGVAGLRYDLKEKLVIAEKMALIGIPIAAINEKLELGFDEADLLLSMDVVEPTPKPVDGVKNSIFDVELKVLNQKSIVSNKVNKQKSEDYINEIIIPNEVKFKQEMRSFFITQRNRILDYIDSKVAEKAVTIDVDLDTLEEKENDLLKKHISPEYERQYKVAVKALRKEGSIFQPFSFEDESFRVALDKRFKKIDSINTTTFSIVKNQVKSVVSEGIQNGSGIAEIKRNLKKAVNGVYSGRINAETIARTEVSAIHSYARKDGFDAVGISKVEWATADDGQVRIEPLSHVTLDGQKADINKGFNNGEKILYPHDPAASKENTINCRCILYPVE